MRVIAVDWSGRASPSQASKRIWLAEVRDGALERLESGRDREELVSHLIEEASADRELIVGLDFAFSFPRWFLEERDLGTARDLWRLADTEGEDWLEKCPPPFWGKPGKGKPDVRAHFRRTDRQVRPVGGIRPKSPFQIGGAGAVGTGSVRGMPALLRLVRNGFSIWPFDEIDLPLVVEIYPRLLTGEVVKSSRSDRHAYLARRFPELERWLLERGASSEDAFDAAVSALVMGRRVDEILRLPPAEDPATRLEGVIWHPDISQ